MAGIFIVFLIISLGFLWWLASNVISEKPFDMPGGIPDMQTSASAMQKINIGEKVSAVLKDKTAGKSVPDKLETIELTENEVNALLKTGLIMQMASKQGADQEVRDAFFKDGALTILISKKIAAGNPFGKYFNIRASFVPEIRNHRFQVVLKAVSAGSISFPESIVQGRLSSELAVLEQTENGQAVLNIISELKLENGRMTLVYSPVKLGEYLQGRGMGMGGMLGGGVGGIGGLAEPLEE